MNGLYWMILFAVLVVIEMVTTGLTAIWFAGGALIAFVISVCGGSLWMQVVIFAAVSVGLLILTRPIAMKYFNESREKTNINSMIGKEGKVTEAINNFEQTGKIIMGDLEWTARLDESAGTEPGQIVKEGTKVRITSVEGVKVYVIPVI